MQRVQIADKNIEYVIIRSNRKTLELSINEEGKIIIKAPRRCSKDFIERFLKEKATWIDNRLKTINKLQKSRKVRDFCSGEKLVYLGQEYTCKVEVKEGSRIYGGFDGKEFTIVIPSSIKYEDRRNVCKEVTLQLYKKLAKKVLQDRTSHYSKVIGVQVNRIYIKEQKTLWGSCSSKNNINYNWKLVMAPLWVLDYVVIHELCHILQRNHSKLFWLEVEKYMPNYKEAVEWLRQHGRKLQLDYIY
ncbi:M48 family metallopeptidase [Clostridium thermarum]|uniref:M48 family metallopeptidase n=1 Tax=Clostridium thermarum TaxID=1716543 RepID=UPI0013D20CEB|nr:SprT family zinc-dependent metalloprotease [Clostridium thermarum]